jgi:hypothetical protein
VNSSSEAKDSRVRRSSLHYAKSGRPAAARDGLRALPGGPFGAPRLLVGRDQRKAATLDLKDQYGRSRLRLVVDSLGESRIEFLDVSRPGCDSATALVHHHDADHSHDSNES